MAAPAPALAPWKTQEPEPFGSGSGSTALEEIMETLIILSKILVILFSLKEELEPKQLRLLDFSEMPELKQLQALRWRLHSPSINWNIADDWMLTPPFEI